MRKRAVILGGGVAGLAAAIGLARRGLAVTVVERDPAPPAGDGDRAFVDWDRRSVAQFRQPHAFTARARNLLVEHAPEVVDQLRADGIEESNLFKLVIPAEEWIPEDDAFTGFLTRRPASITQPGVRAISGDPTQPGPWTDAVKDFDAVVNLVGEGVFNKRWSPSFKEIMVKSRVESTKNFVKMRGL